MTEADESERNAGIEFGLFVLIALLMLADLVADSGNHDGGGTLHVVLEGSIMLLAAAGVLRLWRAMLAARQRASSLSGKLADARETARRWEFEARDALAGMSAAIERQLTAWDLTPAEQAVAILLLGGRSHKEVAAERQTSERTVRQQALAMYRKAGVRSRAELSAFFLRALPQRVPR